MKHGDWSLDVVTEVSGGLGYITLSLAEDLRMERDMVRHCFVTRHLDRAGVRSETVEGIRALAVDKDHQPQWNSVRIEDVTAAMVVPFFDSPWPATAHPLRTLA